MGTEGDTQGAERVLRRLSVAVRTAALYGASHPMTRQAVAGLLEVLRPYLDTQSAFAARITKRGFIVGGLELEHGANRDLAFYLYTRKLSYLQIAAGVREEELDAWLSVVGMDRVSLEAAGGIEYLLWQAKVEHIQVKETALGRQELVDTLDLNVLLALLRGGRLAPQEREIVIEILTAGPDQVKVFLESLYAAIGEAGDAVDQDEQAQQIYQAVRSLDRIILDEPLEDQALLYRNLAQAIVRIQESLRPVLARLLFSTGAQDVGRVIVDHLAGEQLADLVVGSMMQGDVDEQIGAFIKTVSENKEKVKSTLSILEGQLRQPGKGPSWLSDAVWPQLQSSSPHLRTRSLSLLEFDDFQIPVGHREAEGRLAEAEAIDDVSVTREVIATLTDVLRYEDDGEAQAETAVALERHFPWLMEHREYTLLATVLQCVRQITSGPDGTRRDIATRIIRRMTEPPLFDRLLAALWTGRETAAERELQECLKILDGDLIRPLVQALGEEPRAALRAMLCDLLVLVGRDHIDDLGHYLTDPRWYLVRNVASVLGRLRDPRAIAHFDRLMRHEEYRVRREAIDGLASIGTEEAQARLAGSLDDPDVRIRLRALKSLDAVGARRAMPRLVALLKGYDLFNRQFLLRQAAMEVLERVGAREALPVLKTLARGRLMFGPRGRELRRLAARAISVIEAPRPVVWDHPRAAGGPRADD